MVLQILIQHLQLPLSLLPACPCPGSPPHQGVGCSLPLSRALGASPFPTKVSLGGAGRPGTGSEEAPRVGDPHPRGAPAPCQAPAHPWVLLESRMNQVGAGTSRLSTHSPRDLPPPWLFCSPQQRGGGEAALKPLLRRGRSREGDAVGDTCLLLEGGLKSCQHRRQLVTWASLPR